MCVITVMFEKMLMGVLAPSLHRELVDESFHLYAVKSMHASAVYCVVG